MEEIKLGESEKLLIRMLGWMDGEEERYERIIGMVEEYFEGKGWMENGAWKVSEGGGVCNEYSGNYI